MNVSRKSPGKKTSPASPESADVSAIVVGDGWAALGTLGFLLQRLREETLRSGSPARSRVVWITGTGARMLPALPGLEAGPGVELWRRLAQGFGFDPGEALPGSFLREFRNKSFREPAWAKASAPEARFEAMAEALWAPERRIAPMWEARFGMTLGEIEQRIRALLVGDFEEGAPWRACLRRIEDLPVTSFRIEGSQVRSVTLASGEEIACDRIYFADRWGDLPAVTGLPKNLAFIRRREPASVLQATFAHSAPMGVGLQEGFFGSIHKESGEEFERRAWGHFSSDGIQSSWTVCLTGDEVEDNHQIAKKLRRLKASLDKMFAGESWLPAGKAEFMATVASEQVRFQEAVLFAEGEAPSAPIEIPSARGLRFLTDGYGPSSALHQAGMALELSFDAPAHPGLSEGTDAQAEDVHGEGTAAS